MNTSTVMMPVRSLRERMAEDMDLRRLSRATQRNYLRDVARFATWLGRPPDTASGEDTRRRARLPRGTRSSTAIHHVTLIVDIEFDAHRGQPPAHIVLQALGRASQRPKQDLQHRRFATEVTFARYCPDAGGQVRPVEVDRRLRGSAFLSLEGNAPHCQLSRAEAGPP